MNAPGNAGSIRSPERVGDAECGRRVNVAVIWCGIVLRAEVAIIGEERGDVLKNDIAAIGDCRGLVYEE